MKIKIERLQKRFGETIACDVPSFTINAGDVLGLVGNNGAGKTTLFRLMLDLLKADEGEIDIIPSEAQSINVARSEAWKQYVGAYIDDSFLIDYLTPEEYFTFLAKISDLPMEEAKDRLAEFSQFAAGEIFGHKKLIRNLSAGNKQKVGIISAFFRHPELVILDEPFNFLDPTSQNILKRLIDHFNHQYGSTILVSSHNLTHTVDVSSRIALLEHGSILRDIPNNNDGGVIAELEEYFRSA